MQEEWSADRPSRPRMLSHQSNSLPSTPRQHARSVPFDSRTPSPGPQRRSQSPRSVSSESGKVAPSRRPTVPGCRFMTTQTSRRRIPYSIGEDILEADSSTPKLALSREEEKKLTENIIQLYEKLLPSEDNQTRRAKVLKKLEQIISEAWPGKVFEVHVFGSSGNLLYTGSSDVDICITIKDIETTCALAEVLAKRGMRDVKCVHAKAVPIVKIWDPELRLNCDLNLNNHVALKNTSLVKTYMQLDDRVRPLAMIVKYWTKKRIINEASGGTLSSYTWTLLLINFLQTRQPPILPRLQVIDRDGSQREDFSDDINAYSGFGKANTENLGDLLFYFFRRYGYEIDFEGIVVSVREARLLSKKDKNWHMATNNRLCVEEPFNTDRNLGNTADDYAWRGLHLELRRAFERVAVADDIVTSVCEEYQFPPDARTAFERPQALPKPILTRSLSQSGRGGRGGGGSRGNRQHQGRDSNRGVANNNRRASSVAAFGQAPYPLLYPAPQLSIPPEFFLRAQQQPHQPPQLIGVHEQLSQMSQQLSAREQQLRHQQAAIAQSSGTSQGRSVSGRNLPPHSRLPPLNAFQTPNLASTDDPPPATAPLPQFGYPYFKWNGSQLVQNLPFPQSMSQPASETNPSSPSQTPVPLRREMQRNQLPGSPGAAIRSHSQPARPIAPQSVSNANGRPRHSMLSNAARQDGRPEYPVTSVPPTQGYIGPFVGPLGMYYIPAGPVQSGPREYLGYGFTGSPQTVSQFPVPNIPQIPAFDDLRQNRQASATTGGPSHDPPFPEPSRSPSPLPDSRVYYDSAHSAGATAATPLTGTGANSASKATENRAPVIANGSYQQGILPANEDEQDGGRIRGLSDSVSYPPQLLSPWEGDHATHFDYLASPPPVFSGDSEDSELETPRIGTNAQQSQPRDMDQPQDDASSANGAPNQPVASSPEGKARSSEATSSLPVEARNSTALTQSSPYVSPEIPAKAGTRRSTGTGRAQVPPLDISTSPERSRDGQHLPSKILSPVQETRTPSPTSSRKKDSWDERRINGVNGAAISPRLKDPAEPPTPAKVLTKENPNGARKEPQSATATATQTQQSPATNTNPWQQAGKKSSRRSKSSLSQIEGAELKSRGEPMPANASERKGG